MHIQKTIKALEQMASAPGLDTFIHATVLINELERINQIFVFDEETNYLFANMFTHTIPRLARRGTSLP